MRDCQTKLALKVADDAGAAIIVNSGNSNAFTGAAGEASVTAITEAVARALEGQLTCTLQMDAGDTDLARRLMPVLERKAGRVLANGVPTGVEVCEAMVHGGPYPASTNFGATSVGTMAIRRWLRPVSYQNLPEALLPAELQ